MKVIVSIIIFFLYILDGYSQEYPIQKYTPHHGLAQMQVLCILRDSRGIVWAGTYGGLSRFNGETFTNYTTADGLLSNGVTQIEEDSQGNIWVKCGYTHGFVRFDGKTFKKYPFPPSITSSGKLILGADNKKLFMSNYKFYQITEDKIVPYTSEFASFPQKISDVYYFKKLKTYILSIEGQWYIYRNKQLSKIDFNNKLPSLLAKFDDMVVFKSESSSNTTEYYSWDGQATKLFMKITADVPKIINSLPHDYVFNTTQHLLFIPKNTNDYVVVSTNPPLASDYNFNAQPNGDTFWIPTEKGLWQLTRRGFRSFSQEQVPYCWGVVEDKDKNLYFENFQVSLQKFDGKKITTIPVESYGKTFIETLHKLGKTYINANEWYFKPLKDQYQNLWFPSVNGLLKYDYKKWHFVSHNKADPLAFCIAEDKENKKIVACGYNHLYTVDEILPNSIQIIKDDTATIFKSLILSVIVAKNGDYWFSGRGIGRYNPNSKKFSYYNPANKKLFDKAIIGLYADWNNRIWAMGRNDGLFLYDPQRDRFENVLKDFFRGSINLLEQIDDQHLMIGTIDGLHILNLKSFFEKNKTEIKVFNHHNGYMGIEPGQLGSFRDSNGQIWITSSTVLTKMNPKELNLKNLPLKTLITKIGDERVSFNSKNEIINLPHKQNTTTFTVEAVGEDKPFRSQYSFRIKGFLDKWSEWQEQNLIMVNNLPNGMHTIEVRSRTGSLTDTESTVATLKFKVTAPFYKSPNFYKYAFLIGLTLLFIISYFWWKERYQAIQIIEQKKKLDEQENKVRYLQVQTIQAQMNPHFTFNVLGTLQHLILNNETQRASENLLKLSALIRNYLEASLLGDEKTGSLFRHEIQLSKEIELLRMYVEFEQLQYTDRFKYELITDEKINPTNYRLPPLIIQPFVENAIKHGLLYKDMNENGNLWIKFMSINEDTLLCTIEDDGVGREKADEIQKKSLKKYKSRGTQLVNRRVEILNEMGYDIQIGIHNRLEGGTIVTIQIGYK